VDTRLRPYNFCFLQPYVGVLAFINSLRLSLLSLQFTFNPNLNNDDERGSLNTREPAEDGARST